MIRVLRDRCAIKESGNLGGAAARPSEHRDDRVCSDRSPRPVSPVSSVSTRTERFAVVSSEGCTPQPRRSR